MAHPYLVDIYNTIEWIIIRCSNILNNKHKLHLNEGHKISIISKIKNNEHCFELYVQKESGGTIIL